MKYKYCLNEKKSEISTNCYKCTTVVPEDFQIQMQYQLVLDTSDYPKIDNNVFGCPDNWVFEFSIDGSFIVRLKQENENLEPLKEQKRKEMDFKFSECMRKGSETCYVVTSVISKNTGERIVMDNAEIDLTNMRSLIELMDEYDIPSKRVRDYYNNEHDDVTFEEIVKIKFDMMLRGAGLHNQKGIIREQIENATTLEELNAIVWECEVRKK